MAYRFAQERRNYAALAAGTVLHSLPGHPAFPIRLADEIFQRCLVLQQPEGANKCRVLYDPCCGGAYLLTTLGYLHADCLKLIIGSDSDTQALSLAERNLSLLSEAGLQGRIDQIRSLLALYGKGSHASALAHAEQLREWYTHRAAMCALTTRLFQADATAEADIAAKLAGQPIDMVITDIPYGRSSAWSGAVSSANPAWHLLNALLPIIDERSIIAICSDKQQKVAHERYKRVDHFQIGKRRIVILKPAR